MAEEVVKIEDFSFKTNQVASRELDRKFGRPEDYAEIHVLSVTDQLLNSDFNFINYTTPPESVDAEGLISEINMDPVNELNNLGYTSGKYKIKLNLLRRKILNSPISIFSIKEISSSRRELRLKLNAAFNNTETIASIRNFINEVESNIFFKDFGLNFMQGEVVTAINIALDERGRQPELLIKLLNPLSTDYNIDSECSIVEEIIDPTVLTINLGRPEDVDDSIPLRGPNFKIDTRLNSSIPSKFKTYDEILNSSTVLSASYNELLSNLEEDDVLNIDYDYIRTVSGSNVGDPLEEVYHFENFVHFGSAVERLKNFEYKLSLIELYDKDLKNLNSITGPTSASSFTVTAKSDIITKKDKLIQGFDGYEKFLYFTSGSLYTWPKQNTSKPFVLYSITSSQAKTWLGDERSAYPTYGGQLLSASLFDRQNQNNLERLVPNHVLDNPDNEQYRLFANMVGQHFDNVWTHIKHITEIPDTHHTRGISRDLVYFTLKSLGVEAFDQFENSNLIEYILGQGTTGSAFYDTPAQQTLVTASNEGSLPKQDLSKEVWKRLYHNAPHLLKTKGTERGIRALMSCYGIPSTILNVKEYGGPVKDRTGYKTFSYEKSGLALRGDSGTTGFFIKTNWSSSLADTYFTLAQQQKKAIEFRIKPHRLESNQHLFTLSGSVYSGVYYPQFDQSLVLVPYTGNDISSSGDSSQYGKLQYHNDGSVIVETENFPIFNGDFWNIFINASRDENDAAPANTASIDFGAYQSNFNKNIFKHTTSSVIHPSTNTWAASWGQNQHGAKNVYLGGIPANSHSDFNNIDGLVYSGSLQEVRYYFGENLTDDTLTKHALEPFMYGGNTISSSFDNLVLRLPLGSNDQQDSSSFHPNIDINYLQANEGKEQVTNGDFSISEAVFNFTPPHSAGFFGDQDVTISNGVLNLLRGSGFPFNAGRAYLANAAGDDTIKSDLTFGRQYVLRYTVVENDTNAELRLFNGSAYSAILNTVGTHKTIFTYTDGASSTDPVVLQNNGSEGTTIKLDNVSLKELSLLSSDMTTQLWEEVVETHHHPTPDTVGISMTSEKVRTDEGTIDDDILSIRTKSEVSTLDRQPQDFEDLGVFFSPTTEINEDIVYQLGAFRLDDYIGSPLPSAQTASKYEDLKTIRDEYYKRVKRRYNYWDYVKLIQYIDHTLFKLVEQFVPAKANLKTGLLIEPHYLERNKFARELPVVDYGTTMTQGSYQTLDFQIDPERAFTIDSSVGGGNVVTTNNFLRTTGSNSQRQEQGTNFTIDIDDYILDEVQNIAQAPIKPRATGEYGGPDLFGFGTFSVDPPIPDDTTAVDANASPYNIGQPSTAFIYDAGGTPTFVGVRGGKLHITSSGANMGVRYNIPTTEGKEYKITVTVGGDDPGSFFFQNAAGATLTTVVGSGGDQSGDEIVTFTAQAGDHTKWFIRANNNSAGQTNFDNIVIRERITFIDGEPERYVSNTSNILLGNATKAKKSSIYYRVKEFTNIQL